MIDRWRHVRLLADYTAANNELMGWRSWLQPMYANADWAYGAAHAVSGVQRQTWATSSGAVTEVWRGDVRYRSEHPTLKFSGRMDITSGSVTLDYLNASGTWVTVASDNVTGLRYFGGATELTYDTTLWSIPDHGILSLRLMLNGAGRASMYRAYMTGWLGLRSWPTMPTFANSPAHAAGDFNTLWTASQYLKECAQHPIIGSQIDSATHSQSAAYLPIGRWRWRQGGCQRLYVWLYATGMGTGDHVYAFLEPDVYDEHDVTTVRLNSGNPIIDIPIDDPGTGYNRDLSTYGVVKGQHYTVEIGILNASGGNPLITVGGVGLGDLGAVTRTYAPLAEYPYGSQPNATVFNRLKNDLNQMYPAADRESPIWPEHEFATHMGADSLGLAGPTYTGRKFRITHRGRFLEVRTDGGGKIVSADRSNETTIGDSDGDPLTVDTESIPWLGSAFGQDYTVESYGTNRVLVAYEEYE